MSNSCVYSNMTAYTSVPEANSTYLSHTKDVPIIQDPMSGSTMGLMMLLSTFQYQAPYMNPVYANAAAQAGKAAYIESGGQKMEDNLKKYGGDKANNMAHSIGLTDMEMGIVGGLAKTVRDRQINVRGPKIGFIETKLTGTPNSGILGLKWDW